jgi:hypothetical protein
MSRVRTGSVGFPPRRLVERLTGDKVVFEADSVGTMEGSSGEDSEDQPEVMADDHQLHDVRLVPGDYRVECAMGSSVSTASLHVIPASGSGSE